MSAELKQPKAQQTANLLDKKVVVITGGAGFLGRRFCSAVAEHGGIVVVADTDIRSATTVAEKIAINYPACAAAMKIDIRDKGAILNALEILQTQYGRIDAVVNNAYPRNRNYGRKFEDVTYEDFCENVGMHLGGYFLVAQQFALFFSKQGGGNIINMSSIYGIMAPRFDLYRATSMGMPVEYAAIKSSVIHLTKYMAKYLKGTGIRVNAISPGGIFNHQAEEFIMRYNAQCSSKGMLDAADIQGALVFLLSDLSAYVNGQTLVVDDGFSL